MRSPATYIAALLLIAIALAGCELLQKFRPALPAIAAALLSELENVLDAYELDASAENLTPKEAAQIEELQTARRHLIECLIDQIATDYPDVSLTRPLERLNNATGLPPP